MRSTYFLHGPPGSGKTTLGRKVSKNLGIPFYDLDETIEAKTGKTIQSIFSESGEDAFRLLESQVLRELVSSTTGVIALGGGALLDEKARNFVESAGPVVCLTASHAALMERINMQTNSRPLVGSDSSSGDRFLKLMEKRKDHYDSFSNQVDTTGLSVEGSAMQVQTQFGTFRVTGMGDGYEVRVRGNGMSTLPEMLEQSQKKSPVGIVADSNVAPLYGPRLKNQLEKAGYKANLMIIPAGENSKSVSSLELLWGDFLSAGLERSSIVLALGGGVIGDLAGFAAATYMRGISWAGIPTSLLAMVDSSIGGKTGINLEQGKNLAGVFHSPDFVLADPKLLTTLPEVELRNGLAEVVKHGVLADVGLFELLTSGWVNVKPHLEEVVKRAVAVKIKFISADPYEKGLRAALNFGHTLGHALEKGSDYQLRHGEAVSIGMVYETKLAEKMGIAQAGLSGKISELLLKLGLPTQIPTGIDLDWLLKDIQFDKKKKDGVVRFALPVKIGEVQPAVIVKEEDIKWMITD